MRLESLEMPELENSQSQKHKHCHFDQEQYHVEMRPAHCYYQVSQTLPAMCHQGQTVGYGDYQDRKHKQIPPMAMPKIEPL